MKISKLIEILEKLKEKYGNIPIAILRDGRFQNIHPFGIRMRENFKEKFITIMSGKL